MKIFLIAISLAAMVLAEPPPSHSYLPPPPGRSNQGYPRGGPKSQGLEQPEPTGNPFGRPAKDPLSQAKFNPEEGYDRNAAPFGRNGLRDEEPENYEAGELGFKPTRGSSYENSENPTGYDANANNHKGHGRNGSHANDRNGKGKANGRNATGKQANGYGANGNGNRAGNQENDY